MWKGVQGDMTALEFYNAAWFVGTYTKVNMLFAASHPGHIGSSTHRDVRDSRFVAGAQDNCVVYTAPHAAGDAVGLCAVDGDGSVVAVVRFLFSSPLGYVSIPSLARFSAAGLPYSCRVSMVHFSCFPYSCRVSMVHFSCFVFRTMSTAPLACGVLPSLLVDSRF